MNWKIYGTCNHLIWARGDKKPHVEDDPIWCGPCNANTCVRSIEVVTW